MRSALSVVCAPTTEDTVSSPSCGQENLPSSAPVSLVSRDRSGCPVPQQTAYSSHPFLTKCLPSLSPSSFLIATTIGLVPSLSGDPNVYRWRLSPINRVHGQRASCTQKISSNDHWSVLLSARQARVQNSMQPLIPQVARATSYTVAINMPLQEQNLLMMPESKTS